MTQHQKVEFIPIDWVIRAAWWLGLQVYSRPVRIPVDCLQRRKTDTTDTTGIFTPVDEIERALRETLLEEADKPFESVILDDIETLLAEVPIQRNTVAQLAER